MLVSGAIKVAHLTFYLEKSPNFPIPNSTKSTGMENSVSPQCPQSTTNKSYVHYPLSRTGIRQPHIRFITILDSSLSTPAANKLSVGNPGRWNDGIAKSSPTNENKHEYKSSNYR